MLYHLQCVCFMLVSQIRLLETLGMSDIHHILSSTALLNSCRFTPMASFIELVHLILHLPLLLMPSNLSQHYCLFQRITSRGSMKVCFCLTE